MKAMISNVDHGDRVASLETGFSGLENSMNQLRNHSNTRIDQHRNDFNSRLVGSFMINLLKSFTNLILECHGFQNEINDVKCRPWG